MTAQLTDASLPGDDKASAEADVPVRFARYAGADGTGTPAEVTNVVTDASSTEEAAAAASEYVFVASSETPKEPFPSRSAWANTSVTFVVNPGGTAATSDDRTATRTTNAQGVATFPYQGPAADGNITVNTTPRVDQISADVAAIAGTPDDTATVRWFEDGVENTRTGAIFSTVDGADADVITGRTSITGADDVTVRNFEVLGEGTQAGFYIEAMARPPSRATPSASTTTTSASTSPPATPTCSTTWTRGGGGDHLRRSEGRGGDRRRAVPHRRVMVS